LLNVVKYGLKSVLKVLFDFMFVFVFNIFGFAFIVTLYIYIYIACVLLFFTCFCSFYMC